LIDAPHLQEILEANDATFAAVVRLLEAAEEASGAVRTTVEV
jgi:hypothetical protein